MCIVQKSKCCYSSSWPASTIQVGVVHLMGTDNHLVAITHPPYLGMQIFACIGAHHIVSLSLELYVVCVQLGVFHTRAEFSACS